MGIPSGEISFILTPYVSNKTYSLPAILKDKGYYNAFFHGAPNGSMGLKALANLIGIIIIMEKTNTDMMRILMGLGVYGMNPSLNIPPTQ